MTNLVKTLRRDLFHIKVDLKTCVRHSVRRCSSNNQVRVRFAPSPTGQLHLGGLRTAFYNHLFARSKNGKFILRIEDTDQTRLVPGATSQLIDVLDWAGVQVDEGPENGGPYGPYIQSERKALYQDMIQTLLENGTAYHCFCTDKRLALLKKDALRRRQTPKYDNRCRHLSAKEVREKLEGGEKSCIRFKLTEFKEPWTDLVYGPIVCDVSSLEGDPVLMKSDGLPTYHFANVVDDHSMKISHVLRGVEWQVSTTKHILLYKAFGWKPPEFAHLPLLLASSGKKLSKRSDDVDVGQYRDRGILPATIQSFLFQSGSGFRVNHIDIQEMEPQDFVDSFDINLLNTNASKLDFSKLEHLNSVRLIKYLNSPRRSEVIDKVKSAILDKYSEGQLHEGCLDDNYIENAVDWMIKSKRLSTFRDIINVEFLWTTSLQSTDIVKNLLETTDQQTLCLYMNLAMECTRSLSQEDIKNCDFLHNKYKEVAVNSGLNKELKAKFLMSVRFALIGKMNGPKIAEIVNVLGKDMVIRRLQLVMDSLNDQNQSHSAKQL